MKEPGRQLTKVAFYEQWLKYVKTGLGSMQAYERLEDWHFRQFGHSQYQGASIDAISEGAWTESSSHPAYLTFSTTADGESSPTERMRIPNGGGLSVGTTVSPSAVNQQTAVRIGTLNVSQTTISNLTTTWTDITVGAGANGLAFIDIFNISSGSQGNFLVSWRGFPANATVISSNNGTGLTISFQVSSGKLQMQTTSGTVSGAAYVWAS